MLGVSRSTVWRWHAERGLRIVTVGAVTRIRASDLETFLKRHESNPIVGEATRGGVSSALLLAQPPTARSGSECAETIS